MKTSGNSHILNCRKFRQVTISTFKGLLVLSTLFGTLAFAQDKSNDDMLKALNPYSKTQCVKRSPSNFVPSDDIELSPYVETKLWIDRAIVADDAGVLNRVKINIQGWQDMDEYAKNWNIRSTGLYETPSMNYRRAYIMRQSLKYADKRLNGEIKNAEEGSTMAAIGNAQKTLRPQAKVGVGKNVKLKFKASVLQGQGSMIVENPYVDYRTDLYLSGRVEMNMKKEFKKVGMTAGAEYYMTEYHDWLAYVDKSLTQTIRARISSRQPDSSVPFSSDSERKVELMYFKPF